MILPAVLHEGSESFHLLATIKSRTFHEHVKAALEVPGKETEPSPPSSSQITVTQIVCYEGLRHLSTAHPGTFVPNSSGHAEQASNEHGRRRETTHRQTFPFHRGTP